MNYGRNIDLKNNKERNVSHPITPPHQQHRETIICEPTKETLVVGSSITRHLNERDMEDTMVTSISGALIKYIIKKCDKSADIYREVVLVVGGNDCDGGDKVEDLLHKYEDLVDSAKKIISTDSSVKICIVCPRLKERTQERIDAFNAGLAVVSAERKSSFVDNDNYFKTKSGAINKCLLAADGVYLNTSGTHYLIKNIGLIMCSTEQRVNKHTEHKDKMVERSHRPDAGQHNRTCYNCRDPSHGTKECHRRSRAQCYICDTLGHTERWCRS